MASLISAGTSTNTAVSITGDTTGALALATNNGTTALTIDTSQNVGIGTTTPTQQLNFTGNALTTGWFRGGAGSVANPTFTVDGNTGMYRASSNDIGFSTANSERMRIDSSGQAIIGSTSVGRGDKLTVVGAGTLSTVTSSVRGLLAVESDTATAQNVGGAISLGGNYDGGRTQYGAIGGFKESTTSSEYGGYLAFFTRPNGDLTKERARINALGYFRASNSGTYVGATGDYHELTSSGTNSTAYFASTNASSPAGVNVSYRNADPNGTGNHFIYCEGNAVTQRMSVRSNGGIANYSANNVNLSDRREKTNFAPAKSYLDVICAIPVQTFNYIDQNLEEDDGLTLGVVAQDVQEIAPELVHESNWAGKGEPEKFRLSIYQTDLQYALMKSIQELKTIVDAQAVEIAALKAKVGA
jgi:hypothetical protein